MTDNELGFKIGDVVIKKSGKPFFNRLLKQTICGFGYNEQDPKKRRCAIFDDGTVCNLGLLKKPKP